MTKKETKNIESMNIYEKINAIKGEIRKHDFILDKVLPSNLGSSEYASIAQYYTVLHDTIEKYNVFFKWDVMDELGFEKNVFQPVGKMAQHLYTVSCLATFINIDNPEEVVEYICIASGSDSLDKGISSASTLAFRNWFDKNFTPKYLDQGGEEVISGENEHTPEPKIPTYIPPEKKENMVKEMTSNEQTSEDKDIKRVIDKIMEVRGLLQKDDWGAKTLESLINGNISAPELLSKELKIDNKLATLKEDN